jgi:hypothetical protein
MANVLDFLNWGRTSRNLPQSANDVISQQARFGRYGEQYCLPLIPTKHLLADEGSYYVWSNQSPGTVVAEQALKTSFSNTVGIAHIYNKDAIGGKSIYLDYIKLILAGTAPTATQSLEIAIALDNISREPASANRTLLTGVNMSGASIRSSIAQVSQYLAANAFTVTAPSANVRYVRSHIPTGLGITGDEYIIKFGGEDLAAIPGLTAVRASGPGRFVGYAPPVIIDPGFSAVIHRWWLTEATTAPSFELEIGGWER